MIYFIVFILIGSYFLINLFTGVVQLNYHLSEKAAKSKIITEKQSSYVIRVLENYIIIMLSHLPFKNNAYININLLLHNPYFPIEN